MYKLPFSEQWLFDRCVEADALFPQLVVFVSLSLLAAMFAVLRLVGVEVKKALPLTLIAGIPVVMTVGIGGFLAGAFSCTAGPFWDVIRPAHELHARIRLVCDTGTCPKTAGEVERLDPDLYRTVTRLAPTKFVYDARHGTYKLLVRPSQHYLAVFSYDRYGVYLLPSPLPAALLGQEYYAGAPSDVP